MANTLSAMLPLNTRAPSFNLPDAHGNIHSLESLKGEDGTLIIFMCNHCPFVQLYFNYFSSLEQICKEKNISIIGINSNNFQEYKDDSPEKMIETKNKVGFNFTYLVDESQEIAKKYQAMCTPDTYLFDKNLELFYRGQIDSARPSLDIIPDGKDIENAIKELSSTNEQPKEQIPSMGCNIKWKAGNQPL